MINRLVVIIILAAGVSLVMGYAYTTFAYFPKLAHDRDLSQSLVGLTIGLNSLPFMIFSIASPFLMKKFGRKKFLVLPLLICALSIMTFACLDFIEDSNTFFWVAMISRLFNGAGMSTYTTACYSYASILYKENTQKGMGIIKASLGIGPIVSLVVSSFIFKWFGFFTTFATISVGLLINTLAIAIFVKEIKDEKSSTNATDIVSKRSFKSLYIFADARIFGTVINVFFAMTLIDSLAPLMADRLDEFGIPEYLKGLTFLLSNIPFTLTSLLLHIFAKEIRTKRIISCIGWILLGIAFLFIGPSKTLGFPNKLFMVFIGFPLFGASYACLIVTSIPIMQGCAADYDTVNEEYKQVTLYFSGLFNLAYGTGTFIGPLISTRIEEPLGFQRFAEIISLSAFICLIIYILLISLPRSLKVKKHIIKANFKESSLNIYKDDEESETQETISTQLLRSPAKA
ncbi:unnamed protein product [Moneuplotes crassus]|uniref:Major facilitator superfamily (MFS) profile domain-containing protein n=1 Tax=Euplotes crassus TaxID=5936 RepID=A0AAD1UF09_EUPCR|nr:unnamed protein product [Moneuplotes crassus]